MAGIMGKKVETYRLNDVALAIDDLTEQLLLTNKMNAMAILHQQGVMPAEKYHEFLQKVCLW